MDEDKKIRDVWDKTKVVASLLVPISVAFVGFLGTQYLQRQQAAETAHRERQQAVEAMTVTVIKSAALSASPDDNQDDP